MERRADELLRDLPVRVARRRLAERADEDRAAHVAEAVRTQDLGDVDALGIRELLIRVAGAVAPGEAEVLDEEAPIGVTDALLGNGDRHAVGEPALPVPARERLAAS